MDFTNAIFQLINTIINAMVQIVGHVAWPVVVLIIFFSIRKHGFNISALAECLRSLRANKPADTDKNHASREDNPQPYTNKHL